MRGKKRFYLWVRSYFEKGKKSLSDLHCERWDVPQFDLQSKMHDPFFEMTGLNYTYRLEMSTELATEASNMVLGAV